VAEHVLYVNGFRCRLLLERDPASHQWLAWVEFDSFIRGYATHTMTMQVTGSFSSQAEAEEAAATFARAEALSSTPLAP